MHVKFSGAARNVTGSAHLITLDDGFRILLDCGLFQGSDEADFISNNNWGFEPKTVDCVILSHAHIDHTGRLPKLVKDGFTGPVYATHATRNLCSIMLMDSAKIQERDVEWFNKKLLKRKKTKKKTNLLRKPLYTMKDVTPALDAFVGYSYNRWFKIHDKVEVKYQDAGHILGSASVVLKIKQGKKTIKVGFSGDIGRPDRPILRDPDPIDKVDFLICESTYGDKEHELPPQQANKFLDILKRTVVEKKGKLIIPAFSIGRTQEIVYMMDQMENKGLLPKIPVYVDSPLSVNATDVYGKHTECYDADLANYLLSDSDPFGFNSLTYIRSVEHSKALNDSKEPMVIISSSGMMNAGRVRHHMYNNIEDEKNTFLIVGYCAPNTAGGILKTGVEELKIFGEFKQVKAEIATMDSFSAHADRKEMLAFLKNQKKKDLKKIFLVHGEYKTQKKFSSYLKDNGFSHVEIPDQGQEFKL